MDKWEQVPEEEKKKVAENSTQPHRRARRTLSPLKIETPENKSASQEGDLSFSFAHTPNSPFHSLVPERAEMEKDKVSNWIEENPTAENGCNKQTSKEQELSPAGGVFDWIKSFLLSLTVVIFIFTLVFRGVTVDGGSMLPTLENEQYLIISDLLYQPKTGDIVVVQSPHYKNGTEPLIKRIIATGGQTVKINFFTWEVWVDGNLLEEDYILRDGFSTMNCEDLIPDENGEAEILVEENCIFVMGDHRNDSLDSRSDSVGQIDERYIMGRVILRLTPISRFGKVA